MVRKFLAALAAASVLAFSIGTAQAQIYGGGFYGGGYRGYGYRGYGYRRGYYPLL